MRYLVSKKMKGKTLFYWQPKAHYLVAGKWLKCPFVTMRLPDTQSDAVVKAEKMNAELDAWRNGLERDNRSEEGSFDWLICEYKKGNWFKELGDRTRKEYGYILEAIRSVLRRGNIRNAPAKEYDKKSARVLLRNFQETPRKLQLVAAISRIVFNYGIELGEVDEGHNPFDKLKIRKRPAREILWLDMEHENPLHKIMTMRSKAMEMGMESISQAIDLGLWTAQRQGDILSLPWGKFDGQKIKLRQNKTGAWVEIPVMPQLKIASWKRKATIILISERTGSPYTKDHFGDIFREVRKAASIEDELQYRDLRKTSIVMLAMSGCTDTEITAISGHTNSEVSDILETYLPRNTRMAENAIKKMKRSWKEASI